MDREVRVGVDTRRVWKQDDPRDRAVPDHLLDSGPEVVAGRRDERDAADAGMVDPARVGWEGMTVDRAQSHCPRARGDRNTCLRGDRHRKRDRRPSLRPPSHPRGEHRQHDGAGAHEQRAVGRPGRHDDAVDRPEQGRVGAVGAVVGEREPRSEEDEQRGDAEDPGARRLLVAHRGRTPPPAAGRNRRGSARRSSPRSWRRSALPAPMTPRPSSTVMAAKALSAREPGRPRPRASPTSAPGTSTIPAANGTSSACRPTWWANVPIAACR